MSANVETMFYTRTAPWHGLGTRVVTAPNSKTALEVAGLNWNVIQRPLFTDQEQEVDGYKANVRNSDGKVLGVVTDRYKVVQNQDAFAFTDELLGEGVRYETAGSLQEGKRIWLLAKLPNEYIITGERISPYLVLTNTHDGSGAIRAAMTPIRVVCQNTLNLALREAKRSWSAIHTGNIQEKMEEARETLLMAENYMVSLGNEIEALSKIKMTDKKVMDYIDLLLPMDAGASDLQKKNIETLKEDIKIRYFEAPDLVSLDKNGYRFINAVSDFATHSKPLRETKNFRENLFAKTIDGNAMIDKSYELIKAIA